MDITIEIYNSMKKWLYDNGFTNRVSISAVSFRNATEIVIGKSATKANAPKKLYAYIIKKDRKLYLPEKKRPNKKKKVKSNFYKSKEWRYLRVQALTKYGRKCCLCGRSVKDGIILHVDHIKPVSKNPELKLNLSNLQILCEDCNLGKSNKFAEDWR